MNEDVYDERIFSLLFTQF